MNGRIYDAKLGRFLQADPFIQAASNTQSYNRYSYVMNNPLNATDPSGFFFDKLWDKIKPYIGAIVGVVLCVYAACAGSAEALAWGMGVGAMAGAITAHVNGGNPLQGMALGAFSALGYGVGGWIGGALAAGISADIAGGHFGSAFAAAGVSGLIGQFNLQGAEGFIASTIAGGVASEITGNKFANGAATAAFMWALQAGSSKAASLRDSNGHGISVGKCASEGKCHPGDFTPEEKAEIQARVDELTKDIKNKPFKSLKSAAEALHTSELLDLTEEYGLEFWANIDGKTNEIYKISTGFDKGHAYGVGDIRTLGDVMWHTHPSGADVWAGDLDATVAAGASWVFASGKRLTGIQNPNFKNFSKPSQFTFRQMTGMKTRALMYDGDWHNGTTTILSH